MLLVVNTAFMTANLALKTAKGKVFYETLDAKSKHSENVLFTIDKMCKEANVDIIDLKTLAVVVGPGSFTGIRIGTAIAKALGCVNKQLKFVELSSLDCMAYIIGKHKFADGEFACAINALSNLFFVAQYNAEGKKIDEEKMIDKQQFDSLELPKFCINGDISVEGVKGIEFSTEDLLEFALKKQSENDFVDELLPKYIRLSQAEDALLKKVEKHD